MSEMLNNYPDDWGKVGDWEHLDGKCYCERCGAELESGDDCFDTGLHIYCKECYEEKYGEEEEI